MKYVACALLAASAFGAGGCAMYQGLPTDAQGAVAQAAPTAAPTTNPVMFQGSSDLHPWAQRSATFTPPFGSGDGSSASRPLPTQSTDAPVMFQGSTDLHPWAQRSTEFTPPFMSSGPATGAQ